MDWTPDPAELARIAAEPRWRIDVTRPDGRHWTCYAPELNWSMIQGAWSRCAVAKDAPG